ncbi:MAG TPA: type 1 glutamine amidotransferase domain-containing protein [Casimicrobiaceae bacterium]
MNGSNESADLRLAGMRIAVLATDGFEHSELTQPRSALDATGARTLVIAPKFGSIRGWENGQWADSVSVDLTLERADPLEFDALLLPGGALNPDQLRTNKLAISFVYAFVEERKPIAAICHGPVMLIETNALRGRSITSWPSLQTDVRNAGARWTDEPVVVDRNFVTSRKPEDIPAFNRAMIDEFSQSAQFARVPLTRGAGLGRGDELGPG